MKKKKYLIFVLTLSLFTCSLMSTTSASTTDSTNTLGDTTRINVSTVKALPNGGSRYTYTIDGQEIYMLAPPEKFNPIEATDEQLKEYGFPNRPTNPDDLKSWDEEMRNYKSTPIPTMVKTQYKHQLNHYSNNGQENHEIWSGIENRVAGSAISAVQGDFIQPAKNDSKNDTAESSWIGLGGDYLHSSDCLIQAGTSMRSDGYHLWWQYLNSNNNSGEIDLSGYTISPNDHIHLYVSYDDSTQQAYFFLQNGTNGQAAGFYQYLPRSLYYDGSSSEFIEERQTVNGIPYDLAKYNTVSWTNCQTYVNGSWNGAGHIYLEYLTMRVGSTILSIPDTMSSNTSFIDRWKAFS